MTLRFRWALFALAGTALAVPAGADAATKSVFMGTPPASQKTFEKTGSDVNAFFPSSIRVRAGDSVAFTPVGFHSIDFPAAGGRPLALIAPTGKKITGVSDAAGIPFWFNNADQLGFDKRLLTMKFGKTLSKGATRVGSGLPLGDKLKPFKVRFARSGTFTYFCNVHPKMKGTVRVVSKSSPVPSARADALRVKQQAAAALAVAKKLRGSVTPPANTVSVGAEGKGGVTFFGFLPDKLTVPTGTTVKFAMPATSTEDHTATTGPGDADKATTYLGAIAKSFQGAVFDGRATYPSEVPGTPPAGLSPALHGNGYWNSGVMDALAASPLPAENSVRFTTPGTYNFVCLIHTFMKGTVTVQ